VSAALACVCAGAGAAPAGATEGPLLLKPAIPPELQALETKGDAMQITSLRTSVSFTLTLGKVPKKLREFLRLLEFRIDSVETTAPPAAALTMRLFGAHVRLRVVEGKTYMFNWALGRHDGGRPWIALGHGALGRAFGELGKSKEAFPTSGAARFGKLFTLVNGGTDIRALAPTTLYGQPVTGFQGQVERKRAGEGGGPVGVLSAARPREPAKVHPQPPEQPLTIYFAASGAPVRVQLQTGTGSAGELVTIDYPAINFPMTIPPPPPSHVITETELLKRVRPHGAQRSESIIVGNAIEK
jgi:hypothetical protein